MILAALCVSAYLLGSIPFAVLLGRLKGVDVLKEGSGNPGMTNLWRAVGPVLGTACFALDIAKGLAPTVAARFLIPHAMGVFDAQFIWFCVGIVAIIGHCASVFLRFKGGKGISTSLGVILGASPLVALACLSVFGVFLLIWRYVSLASIVGVGSVVPFNFIFPNQSIQLIPIFSILTIFVIVRHRSNIRRILDGTERKV